MTLTIWKTSQGAAEVEARYRAILQHWPQPNRQVTVPTREGDTFVVSCGPEDAPPLVLLHGSASNAFMWMGDAALWSRHFRVHAVDIIGEPGLSAPSRPTLASGAYPGWLDDVLAGLAIETTALVGLSLGGWLALDYATRRPERVRALVVLCPGGVGRHRNVLLWALPLLLLGPWGRRKVSAIIAGPKAPDAPQMPAAVRDFLDLIYKNFRVRRERLPVIGDDALRRLAMPVLAILGGKDAMIDSAGTRRRLEQAVPHVQIRWLEEQGHFLRGQAAAILDFLQCRGLTRAKG
ncbi:MAG: alpha/beta fold hydrolase [Rhizomicrobium sp.]